jgi:adenylate cyclase
MLLAAREGSVLRGVRVASDCVKRGDPLRGDGTAIGLPQLSNSDGSGILTAQHTVFPGRDLIQAAPWRTSIMADVRKISAIVAAGFVGYRRLSGGADDRALARLRALRRDLIGPTIAQHRGRVVRRTEDGIILQFRSVVDAVRCAIDVQRGMIERNAGLRPEGCIELCVGIHLGDAVADANGVMGEGANIAAGLQSVASPGAICLSEDAYRRVKARLDPSVSVRGLIAPGNTTGRIRVFSLEITGSGQRRSRMNAKPLLRIPRVRLMPIALWLVLVSSAAWYFIGPRLGASVESILRQAPAHLSIVVLPFRNLSYDPSQDYFADGVTENLTADLSRIRNSFVIARNTASSFKGATGDASAISKQLGVRYVLEGSVLRDGSRVSVDAQLVDGDTGAGVWDEHFDDDLVDVFKLQERVVARLANALGHELVKAEAQSSLRATNPDVIDLDMRGWSLASMQTTRDSNQAARGWFERALKLDPNDADALAGMARTYLDDYSFGWTDPGIDYDAAILAAADRSIALSPGNARAYHVKSAYLFLSRRAVEALGAADAGLLANPNFAALYGSRSGAEISLGRFERAISDAQQAMQLSPRDPIIGIWHVLWGDAELGLGNFDNAVEQYRKAIAAGLHTYVPYANMAAGFALAGKIGDARTAMAEARRLNPGLTVKALMAHAPDLPRLSDGAGRAGLQDEGSGAVARSPATVVGATAVGRAETTGQARASSGGNLSISDRLAGRLGKN